RASASRAGARCRTTGMSLVRDRPEGSGPGTSFKDAADGSVLRGVARLGGGALVAVAGAAAALPGLGRAAPPAGPGGGRALRRNDLRRARVRAPALRAVR